MILRPLAAAPVAALVAVFFLGLPRVIFALETGDTDYTNPLVIEENGPDRNGLRHDTWYFVGYQWITIGLLYAAPESVSGWTDEQKENYDLSTWSHNVTHPEWDTDDWYINYIAHPYWGGAYYVRARERGYNDRQAFWYSVLLSSLYELGAEALFEEVSIQDIFVTPLVGTWVGRYFVRIRNDIRDREIDLGYRTRRDKWVWTLTDPLGALNNQFDRLTGRNVSVQLRPYVRALSHHELPVFAKRDEELDVEYGFEFKGRW